ncbi:MAG: DNA starvation/stationary phase protection protein [Pseudomonadota bacterium]
MSATQTSLKSVPSPDEMSLGIGQDNREQISHGLSHVLADTYSLLIKTHIYHWNVVGPLFYSLHQMMEEQYNDLFEATDVLAERVRALGFLAPVGMKAPASGLGEPGTKRLSAEDMVKDLIADHEEIVRKMRDTAEEAAERKDIVTEDLLVERLSVHEKNLWMLRSIIAE